MHKQKICIICISIFFATISGAEPREVREGDLQLVQDEIRRLETGINSAKYAEATLATELQKLDKLLRLQALEIQLSTIELEKMEEKVQEMQVRRDSLQDSIQIRKKRLRDLLSVLPSLEYKTPMARLSGDNTMYLFMFREMISKLLAFDRQEIIALKKYLDEADDLNLRLEEERTRILAKSEDLKEKQIILTLNKDQKKELLKKTRSEQGQRLRAYHAAKAAEEELETILNKVNIAADLKRKSEEKVSLPPQTSKGGSFVSRKGKLQKPVDGTIITAFGKKYDPETSLYTFHKGIDIRTEPSSPVRAIFPGKVVFSGSLGAYGRLLIIDHGEQYYSLVGHLGDVLKKEGDTVSEGEQIARSSTDNAPLYFEIRQRHIAVNPAPWLN